MESLRERIADTIRGGLSLYWESDKIADAVMRDIAARPSPQELEAGLREEKPRLPADCSAGDEPNDGQDEIPERETLRETIDRAYRAISEAEKTVLPAFNVWGDGTPTTASERQAYYKGWDDRAALSAPSGWISVARAVYEATRQEASDSGRTIVPEPWESREPAFRAQFQKTIERICAPGYQTSPEREHESWMRAYEEMGWKYGPVRDRGAKTHPDMVPFSELPKDERDKDAIFLACCAVARDLISALSAPSGWISVKERPIPEHGEFLAHSTERGHGFYDLVFRAEDMASWSSRTLEHVTHWMPLPAPPKEGNA